MITLCLFLLLPADSLNMSCECDDACNVASFSAEASYSVMPVHLHVLGSNMNKILSKYLYPFTIRQCTDVHFVNTMEMLGANIALFSSSVSFIRSRILDRHTSIPVMVEDIIDHLVSETNIDVKTTLFGDFAHYIFAFRTFQLQGRKAFLTALTQTAHYMQDYQAVINSMSNGSPVDDDWARQVQNEGSYVLPYAKWALIVYRQNVNVSRNVYAPTILNADTVTRRLCDLAMADAETMIDKLIHTWANAKQEVNFEHLGDNWMDYVQDDVHTFKLPHLITDFARTIPKITDCISEYYEHLEDTEIFLELGLERDKKFHSRSLTEEEEIAVLNNDMLRIKQLTAALLQNDMSLIDLAENLEALNIASFGSHLGELQVRVSQSILQPLRLHLQEAKGYMMKTYKQALHKAVVHDAYFENKMLQFSDHPRNKVLGS